jgi:hypothetical protein
MENSAPDAIVNAVVIFKILSRPLLQYNGYINEDKLLKVRLFSRKFTRVPTVVIFKAKDDIVTP